MSSSGSALALFGCLSLALAGAALAQERPAPPGRPGIALAPQPLGIGRPAAQDEISGWDIDARPDGRGLPPGRGSVRQGEALYQKRCAACHGDFGEGRDRWPALVTGSGRLTADDDPRKGVGNYWPYATTLFDYIRRAMPFGDAQSLTDDEVYAVTAYVLQLNDIVKEDAVLDRGTLPGIRLPNAGGFTADPRPDVKAPLCMKNCKDKIEIHSEAREANVTPADARRRKDGPAGTRAD